MIPNAIIEYGSIGAFRTTDIFKLNDNCKPEDVHTFESQVDTSESSLTFVGDRFPNLEKLRLNNSIIPCVRDIGCAFSNLKFLSLARCGLTSLSGIATISNALEELYLAMNNISDVSDLMGMDSLKVLDLEDNQISNLSNIEFLTCCSGLKSLTMTGNPCVDDPEEYRLKVIKLVPSLVYLDEKRLKPKQPKKKTLSESTPPRKNRFRNNNNNIVNDYNSQCSESPERRILNNNKKVAFQVQEPDKNKKIVQIHEPKQIKEPEEIKLIKEPPMRVSAPSTESTEYQNDDEVIITEMLDDIIEDRPPTSRGNYENQFFKDNLEIPPRNRTSKGFKNRPHVITPRVRRFGRCVSSANKV